MMNIYKNISDNIQPDLILVISAIDEVVKEFGMEYFIVGARARDLIFSSIYGIPTPHNTIDVDLGIRVNSWDEVFKLTAALEKSGKFRSVNNTKSRFIFDDTKQVDLLPFGEIKGSDGKITWKSQDNQTMSIVGFEEAFRSSIVICLRDDPALNVRVCTPAGIVILKFVSWDEKYPDRSKDAEDIFFILQNYIDTDIESRLYEGDQDVFQLIDPFDTELAGARLLGRDIAKIATPPTIGFIKNILENIKVNDSSYRLIIDMVRGEFSLDEAVNKAQNLLIQLKKGIEDSK